MLDRFVIIIVELLDGCLIARTAHGAVDERVRFPGCFDRFASGLVVDGEETRLPPVIGFGSMRVVVQASAERDTDEIGIGSKAAGEKFV